jgi:transcriptional regulator with XRE-family HTH domain
MSRPRKIPCKRDSLALSVSHIRRRLGMSQITFSQMININQSSLSRLEAGLWNPSVRVLMALLSLSTGKEREAVLSGLQAHGVDLFNHTTSIHQCPEASNVRNWTFFGHWLPDNLSSALAPNNTGPSSHTESVDQQPMCSVFEITRQFIASAFWTWGWRSRAGSAPGSDGTW